MTYAAPAYPLVTPQVIACSSGWAGWGAYLNSAGAIALTDRDGPAAFTAIYVPFVVTTPATFRRGFWWNGSAPDGAANIDVGIYTPDGTKRASTGNVLKSGASVLQQATFTANYDASPGTYYMAIICSVADVLGIFGHAPSTLGGRMAGMYQQAVGSNPLPANATFEVWSATPAIPSFGVAQTTFAI